MVTETHSHMMYGFHNVKRRMSINILVYNRVGVQQLVYALHSSFNS